MQLCIISIFMCAMCIQELTLDGDSEHVAHALVTIISLFGEKNIRFVTALALIKCLIQIKSNRYCSLRAHLFLGYHAGTVFLR